METSKGSTPVKGVTPPNDDACYVCGGKGLMYYDGGLTGCDGCAGTGRLSVALGDEDDYGSNREDSNG